MKTTLLSAVLPLAVVAAEPPWPMFGMDAYRNYDLYNMRDGEQTIQYSSYDKFNGKKAPFSCNHQEDGFCVLAEVTSNTGQLTSIFIEDEADSAGHIGAFHVGIDGRHPVYVDSADGYFKGYFPPPFDFPLMNDCRLGRGGNSMKIPMPFTSSTQVASRYPPRNYAVTFRRIPNTVKFPGFDPDNRVKDRGDDVVAAQRLYGVADPKLTGKAETHVSGEISKSKPTLKLASTCGMITKLAIRVPSIKPTAFVDDDGYAIGVGRNANMTLALDKNNDECKFTWRIDAGVAHQKVKIYVDDKVATNITSGPSRPGTWDDMVVKLPSAMTNGKEKLKIRLQCVSSDVDCNIFNVALHCTAKEGKWASSKYMPGKDWTLMTAVDVGPSNRDIENKRVSFVSYISEPRSRLTLFRATCRFSLFGAAVANTHTTTSSIPETRSLICT